MISSLFPFFPISILLQKHAILLQSQSWNQRTIAIWVGIKCMKWRAMWNRNANLLAFQKKTNKQNKKTPTSSPPQEILWRENWHLLCLAGLLHQYADRGCSCRSWLFSVWMPDKGQLHMEVPDQAWFNITCDFEQSCTEGDGTGFARHCLMKEAKLKALRTTAVVDLKAKA